MSLHVDYNTLLREVGRMLGIDRDKGFFEPDQLTDIKDIIAAGLRRHYWHAVVLGPDEKPLPPHSWSYLKPVRTLDLKSDTSTYDLPEDFGELIEPVFTWAANAANAPIAVVSERHLRSLASQANRTGVPRYAALRPKSETGGIQRQEVVFYPTPTADATISYRSSIIPQELDEDHPYPLGGAQHSEAILEACLAEAEVKLHDAEGVHSKRYAEALLAAIQSDQKLNALEDGDIWPFENAVTGLSVNKAHLRRLIGRQLGIGSHPAAWTHKQSNDVQLALDAGLRDFYTAHNWSFLKPLLHLFTVSGQTGVDLPADFAMLDGPLTYDRDDAVLFPAVDIVGEHQIRQYQNRGEASGRPQFAAVSLKSKDLGVTAYELLLWPVPDDSYGLRGRYSANPFGLGEETTLPFGGQFHAQTVIECVLAAAERQLGVADGIHAAEYAKLIERSIRHDQDANSPSHLGLNLDRSDRVGPDDADWHDMQSGLVLYTGYSIS
jgi:hypothetical protein